VRPLEKKSIIVSNLKRTGSLGNRAFLGGISDQMKVWIVFGRLFILSPKNSISRASADMQTGPSHGGRSGCIAPTTNLTTHIQGICEIFKTNFLISPRKNVVENNENNFTYVTLL
jgi:hypothetical protein